MKNSRFIANRFIFKLGENPVKQGTSAQQMPDLDAMERAAAGLDRRLAKAPQAKKPEKTPEPTVTLGKELSKNVPSALTDIAKKLKEKGFGPNTSIAIESFENKDDDKVVRIFVNGKKFQGNATDYKVAFEDALRKVDNYEYSDAKKLNDNDKERDSSEKYEKMFGVIYKGFLAFKTDNDTSGFAAIVNNPPCAAAITRNILKSAYIFGKVDDLVKAEPYSIRIEQDEADYNDCRATVDLKITTTGGKEYILSVLTQIGFGDTETIEQGNVANSSNFESQEYHTEQANNETGHKKELDGKIASIREKITQDKGQIFRDAPELATDHNISILADTLILRGYTEQDIARVRLKQKANGDKYVQIDINYGEQMSVGKPDQALYQRPVPYDANPLFSYNRESFALSLAAYDKYPTDNDSQHSFESALNNIANSKRPNANVYNITTEKWEPNPERAKYDTQLEQRLSQAQQLEALLLDKNNYQGLFAKIFDQLEKDFLLTEIQEILNTHGFPETTKIESLIFNTERKTLRRGFKKENIVIVSIIVNGKYLYGIWNETTEQQNTFTELLSDSIMALSTMIRRNNIDKSSKEDFEKWKNKIK